LKAPFESLRWHKYSAKLIFYLLIDCMHCTYVQSGSLQFIVDLTKYGEQRARAECQYCRGTDYNNSGFSGTK